MKLPGVRVVFSILSVRTMIVLACCAACLTPVGLLNAEEPSDLPANWQQLSPKDFAYAVDPFYDRLTNRPKGNFDEVAVQKHAAALFLKYDLADVHVSGFPTIYRLYRAGWRELDDDQHATVHRDLVARRDDWSGRSYEENLSKVMLMDWVDVPFERMSREVIRFFDSGGSHADVWANDLQDYARLAVRGPKVARGKLRIHWKGQLTAPKSGEYTFSICSADTYRVYGDYSMAQSMKVVVGGRRLIVAAPGEWRASSDTVELTAGNPTDIEVEYLLDSQNVPRYAAHAVLSWQGPGIEKEAVPASQLTIPGGDDNGLQATYSWTTDRNRFSIERVDNAIDFSWSSGDVVVAGDTTIKDGLLEKSWQNQTSTAFLDSLIGADGKVTLHPWAIDPYFSAQNLSSAKRLAFQEILSGRPVLLDAFSARRIVGLYRGYRIGATETALDLFGQWAWRNANLECEMPQEIPSRGFDYENRKALHLMGMSVATELPDHADRLRDEFLEIDDGSCCLPVAYALGYRALIQNRLDEWTEFLDARLAQETLTGSKRVNWLIAKAHAREIRFGRRDPHAIVEDSPMEGIKQLKKALLAADDPGMKVKVAKQLAARFAYAQQFAESRAVMDETEDSLPAEAATELIAFRATVEALEAKLTALEAARAAMLRQSRLQGLQRRRDKAAADGNTRAVKRYDALIRREQAKNK